jgi:hypothetical protein
MPDAVPTLDTAIDIANWFWTGWQTAMREDSPTRSDPRVKTVSLLLPALDPLDDSSANRAAVMTGLFAVPFEKLKAELARRRGQMQGAFERRGELDPMHGRRIDTTTTDIARGAGEALGAAAGGILSGLTAFLKQAWPWAAGALGVYLIATNMGGKKK